jgi:hypothetical protein
MGFRAETSAKTSGYNVVSPYKRKPLAEVVKDQAFTFIQSKNKFPTT